ncbi:hypothetical protein IMSHALPRED_006374 [Imshaugia aleurites]|uniref:RRM domain-containing protein n=1 Tax=Imshaugia aleurites TaxID=172621 RepID=A0A8H3FJX4_9LECA|nr:hypothetical protein IMSHALPRED_006374 [Imshaugia aleurites]
MNTIREIQNLNKRELENGVSTEASWHADYRDTAYVYIGGLPFDLSEGDILTIFSQYGEPTYINLVRDKESGKSKGFAFLKYEDQRSTDLAVDNLGGASVMGRVLKVDHTRYKRKDGEEEEERERGLQAGVAGRESEGESSEERRPLVKEEQELRVLLRDYDDDDPMKDYLMGGWRGRGRKSISIDIIITVTDMIMGKDEGAIRMERRKIAADRAMVTGIVIAIGGGRELPEYPGYSQGYNYDNRR